MLLRGVAAAQNDAAYVRAEDFGYHVLKQHVAGKIHAELRVHALQRQAQPAGKLEGGLFLAAFVGHLFVKGYRQAVGQQRHRAQEGDFEPARRAQDGFGRAVFDKDGFKADEVAPQQVDHEAEDVVEGQKSQGALGLAGDDAPVGVVQQLAVEHLVADGLLIVHKDAAGGRGAAGA